MSGQVGRVDGETNRRWSDQRAFTMKLIVGVIVGVVAIAGVVWATVQNATQDNHRQDVEMERIKTKVETIETTVKEVRDEQKEQRVLLERINTKLPD